MGRIAMGTLIAAMVMCVSSGVPEDFIEPGPRFEPEWSGCASVQWNADAPICVIDRGTRLRMWIVDPRAERAEVLVDGEPTPAERYVAAGEHGFGLRIGVSPGAKEITVRVLHDGAATWSLRLTPPAPEPDLVPDLDRIRDAYRARDADALQRATVRATQALVAEGRVSTAVDIGLGAASLARGIDANVASMLLVHVEDAARRYPKGRADLAAYRGVHEWHRGNIQDAEPLLREATRHALRMEDAELARDAMPMYAETLAELGDFASARRWATDALAIVREQAAVAQTKASICVVGSVLRTVGWLNLQLRRRGQPHDDPAAVFEEALRVFGPGGGCPRPAKLGGVRLSLALIAKDEGAIDRAAAVLEAIDRDGLPPEERVLVQDLAVELSLLEPHDRRNRWRRLAALERVAMEVGTPDARWRLHTRRGQLHALERDHGTAIEAYRLAERELDALIRLRAIGVGRAELAERYHESTSMLVDLLVREGRAAEAFCVTREAQARRRTAVTAPRALSAADRNELHETIHRYRQEKQTADALLAEAQERPGDEAEAMRQSAADADERARELAHTLYKTLGRQAPSPTCAELTPPAPGELLLGIDPHAQTWFVFGQDEHGVVVTAIARPDPGETQASTPWLEPLADKLEHARRIRVLAHREAQGIAIERLPWRGEPLGVRVPIGYGVELRAASEAVPGRRALLVSDPTETLAHAPAEIAAASQRLRAAGWSVTVRPHGAQPFSGIDFFHYAGHTEARPDDAWLWLGSDRRLTVHDVLTTRPVPRAVFLAACRTSTPDVDTGETSMALAFLVAGAHQVVASTEAVDDREGVRIGRRLIDALAYDTEIDLVDALHRAQRDVYATHNAAPPYRVWVR